MKQDSSDRVPSLLANNHLRNPTFAGIPISAGWNCSSTVMSAACCPDTWSNQLFPRSKSLTLRVLKAKLAEEGLLDAFSYLHASLLS